MLLSVAELPVEESELDQPINEVPNSFHRLVEWLDEQGLATVNPPVLLPWDGSAATGIVGNGSYLTVHSGDGTVLMTAPIRGGTVHGTWIDETVYPSTLTGEVRVNVMPIVHPPNAISIMDCGV